MVPKKGKDDTTDGEKLVPGKREEGTKVEGRWYQGRMAVVPGSEEGNTRGRGEVYTKGWEDGSVVSESRWIGTRVGGGRTMVEGR